VLIDCGLDWRGRLEALRPQAIMLTHAHPDHAGGLRDGAPCPVYATEETWTALRRYPLDKRERVRAREPFTVGEIRFEAFQVEHSVLAPAVGYRIEAGPAATFYGPGLDRRRAGGARGSRSLRRGRGCDKPVDRPPAWHDGLTLTI
jgi:phosphoribosyl 1,2-cyclic phosphodiesterase